MIALLSLAMLLMAFVGSFLALFTMDTGPDWVGSLAVVMVKVGLWVGIPAGIFVLLVNALTALGLIEPIKSWLVGVLS